MSTIPQHEFEVFEGATGMSCTAMVLRDGGGDQCGLPPGHAVHRTLPLHRTEAGWPNCATCDGGGCPDCTDPAGGF